MEPDVHVDHDVLLHHARRVARVADAVGEAAQAAWYVDLHGGAFGLMCSFLPPVLNRAEGATADALVGAVGAVGSAADGVRAMALAYEAADDGVRGRLGALSRRLG